MVRYKLLNHVAVCGADHTSMWCASVVLADYTTSGTVPYYTPMAGLPGCTEHDRALGVAAHGHYWRCVPCADPASGYVGHIKDAQGAIEVAGHHLHVSGDKLAGGTCHSGLVLQQGVRL